jgi:preprotein translocase subunit SecF
MYVPILLFVIALASLAVMQTQTGSYVGRSVDLVGGRLITIEFSGDVDQTLLESELKSVHGDVSVRVASGVNTKVLLIQTGLDAEPEDVIASVGKNVNVLDSSHQETGAVLGEAFWSQTQVAILFAFILMASIVFIIFRKPIPSVAVILNSLFNLIITLAFMNFLGIKLSLAGLAGILMLLGYSVDTNIVLISRVTKSLEESFNTRVISAMRTGLTMTATTFAALLCLYLVSTSPVLSEVALILIIGLAIDTMNTWTINVGLLKRFIGDKEWS